MINVTLEIAERAVYRDSHRDRTSFCFLREVLDNVNAHQHVR